MIAVPLGLAIVIALAVLSYFGTRSTITGGQTFAAAGTRVLGKAFVVEWRSGTDIAIVVSFSPSRKARVRSVTLEGLDPKDAFIESSEYGFWNGQTPLPAFATETDPLPADLNPRPLTGSFIAPAHSRVIVRLVVRAIEDATGTDVLTGIRVDAESWAWAHSTVIPFEQPVKLQRPG